MDLLKVDSRLNDELLHKELTDVIIACFYRVYNDLGYGFLERVYQNALYYALDRLNPANEKQLINYLKATEFEVGLLLNFGKTPQIKRKIFSNDNK